MVPQHPRSNGPVPQIPHNQDAITAYHFAAMQNLFQARGVQLVPGNRFQGYPRAPVRNWLRQEVAAVPRGHPNAWQQPANAHPRMMMQHAQVVSQQSLPRTVIDLTGDDHDDATPAMPLVEVAREFSVPINPDATAIQKSPVAVLLPSPPQLALPKMVALETAATSRKRKATGETAPTSPPKKSKTEVSKQKERASRPLTAAEIAASNDAVRAGLKRIDRYAWQAAARAAAAKQLSSSPSLQRKKVIKTQNKTSRSVEATDKRKQSEPGNLPTPASRSSTIDKKSSEEPEQPSPVEQPANLRELFSGGEEREENINNRPSAFYPVPEEGHSDDDSGLTIEWHPKTREDIPAPVAIPSPTKRAPTPKQRSPKPKKDAFELSKSKVTKTDKTSKPRGTRAPYNTSKRRREAAAEQVAREEAAARMQAMEKVADPTEGDTDELEAELWAWMSAEGIADMEDSPITDLQAAPEKDGVANMGNSPPEEGMVPGNNNEGQGEELSDISGDEFESDEDETEEEAAARLAKYERRKRIKQG